MGNVCKSVLDLQNTSLGGTVSKEMMEPWAAWLHCVLLNPASVPTLLWTLPANATKTLAEEAPAASSQTCGQEKREARHSWSQCPADAHATETFVEQTPDTCTNVFSQKEEAWAAWNKRKEALRCRREQRKNCMLGRGERYRVPYPSARMKDVVMSFAVPEDFGQCLSSSAWPLLDAPENQYRTWS